MRKQICLGTAQFGKNYGVTNINGIIEENEIKKIIKKAIQNNINFLDTAKNYGESEKILGQLKVGSLGMNVITKYSFKNACLLKSPSDYLKRSLTQTLKNIKLNNIYGILIHDELDINNDKFDEFIETLISFKKKGIVKKIGCSIYKQNDIKTVPLDLIDIIQLPVSIYDQRILNNNFLNYLKKNSIEIFARSIFLQGITLSKDLEKYKFISEEFKQHHNKIMDKFKSKKTNMLKASLDFCESIKEIDKLVLGISSFKELLEIINVIKTNPLFFEWSECAWSQSNDLDPRRWKVT